MMLSLLVCRISGFCFVLLTCSPVGSLIFSLLFNALGDNGTINGQGSVWWDWFNSRTLNYSRPHLVEIVASKDVVVSNLTFVNSPAYNIHPVYCRFVS